MEVVFVIIALLIVLFIVSFVHGRRFGLLGLALATGSLLSSIWSYDAGIIASGIGVPYSPLTKTAVASIITLFPAGVLLFHGDTYKSLIGRLTGAILFSILAVAFMIQPLEYVLMPQGVGADLYTFLIDNQNVIIGIGLIISIVDLFLTKPSHSREKGHKH
jgi:hypothetical protein